MGARVGESVGIILGMTVSPSSEGISDGVYEGIRVVTGILVGFNDEGAMVSPNRLGQKVGEMEEGNRLSLAEGATVGDQVGLDGSSVIS